MQAQDKQVPRNRMQAEYFEQQIEDEVSNDIHVPPIGSHKEPPEAPVGNLKEMQEIIVVEVTLENHAAMHDGRGNQRETIGGALHESVNDLQRCA
jgi:hypothetical protein